MAAQLAAGAADFAALRAAPVAAQLQESLCRPRAMHIGVELVFAASSEGKLTELAEALQNEFVPRGFVPYGPFHVRLAALVEEPVFLRSTLERIAREVRPFELDFDRAGSFPQGVVYLAPRDPGRAMDVHSALHEQLARHHVTGSPHYDPSVWTPHCTMAVDIPIDQLKEATAACASRAPGALELVGIGVIEYGPICEKYRLSFSGPNESA